MDVITPMATEMIPITLALSPPPLPFAEINPVVVWNIEQIEERRLQHFFTRCKANT
jgi:hypothetical protein